MKSDLISYTKVGLQCFYLDKFPCRLPDKKSDRKIYLSERRQIFPS
jgi:hypothetical protein